MIDHRTGVLIGIGAVGLFLIHVLSDVAVFVAGYQFGKNGGKLMDRFKTIICSDIIEKRALDRQNQSSTPEVAREPTLAPEGNAYGR